MEEIIGTVIGIVVLGFAFGVAIAACLVPILAVGKLFGG